MNKTIKWNVTFEEKSNKFQKILKKTLPLDLMHLTEGELDSEFVISSGGNKHYTSRELVFKLYDNGNCRILRLNDDSSVTNIIDLLTELPPVYVFHSNLSLTKEKFTNLSKLNVVNAIYSININGYRKLIDKPLCRERPELFLYNLNKVVEEGLQFHWVG